MGRLLGVGFLVAMGSGCSESVDGLDTGDSARVDTGSVEDGGEIVDPCPAEFPGLGGLGRWVSCDRPMQVCGYGEQCCGGSCYAEWICYCSQQRWSCQGHQACHRTDGGSPDSDGGDMGTDGGAGDQG